MFIRVMIYMMISVSCIQAGRQDFHAKKSHLNTVKQEKFYRKRLDNLLYSKQYHSLEALAISPGRVQGLASLTSNWRFFDFYYDDTSLVATTDDILFVVFASTPQTISKAVPPSYDLITEFATLLTGDIDNIRSGGGFIAVTNKTTNDIDIWNSAGVHQSTISNATKPIDFALSNDNGGTLYIAFENTLKKYLVNGTFTQDYPQSVNFNSPGDIHFLTSYPGGDLFFTGSNQNNNTISIVSSSTGANLTTTSLSLSGLSTKTISNDNKLFILREDETTADSFINIVDFSTIGSPVEGRYLAGTVNRQYNDFALAGNKVFKISIIPPSTNTEIVAWSSTDPSSFPGSPKTLDYTARDYEITPTGTEKFVKLAGDTNYIVALSQDGPTQAIRSYNITDGSPHVASFALPPTGTITDIASSDNDKVFAVVDNTVYSFPSDGLTFTALAPTLTNTAYKLLTKGNYVAVQQGEKNIEIWSTLGTHLSSIATVSAIKDFTINDEGGGTLYISLTGSDTYQKYEIATGTIIGSASAIPTSINGMIIAPNVTLTNSIIYVVHNNSSEVTAIDEKTGAILGNATTPGTVSHLASMQVASGSLLYLAYGNQISIFQEGSSLNLSIPSATVTTTSPISNIAVTQNGNLFAAHGNTLEGWNTIGTPLLANPIIADFPIEFLVADTNVFYSLA